MAFEPRDNREGISPLLLSRYLPGLL